MLSNCNDSADPDREKTYSIPYKIIYNHLDRGARRAAQLTITTYRTPDRARGALSFSFGKKVTVFN